jgi:hypothetical protein
MAPQGNYGLIDGPAEFDIGVFYTKSISVDWQGYEVRLTRVLG